MSRAWEEEGGNRNDESMTDGTILAVGVLSMENGAE
jgi:hypothetical protein